MRYTNLRLLTYLLTGATPTCGRGGGVSKMSAAAAHSSSLNYRMLLQPHIRLKTSVLLVPQSVRIPLVIIL